MTLPDVAQGDPHVAAHNNERHLINAIQNVTDVDFASNLADSFIERENILRTSTFHVRGHSYAEGVGASDYTRDYSEIVSRVLRLPLVQDAVQGSSLTYHTGSGGWSAAMQRVTRIGKGLPVGSGVTATGLAPFVGPGGLVSLMWGINDLNAVGNTLGGLSNFINNLRAVISRLRAGVVIESDNTTHFTYAGTWATAASTNKNSGVNWRYTSASGSTATFAVPADFPGGGHWTFQFISQVATSIGQGATVTVTDGSTEYVVNTLNPKTNDSMAMATVLRIPGGVAGARNITLTFTNVATLAGLDCAWWEPADDDTSAPLVLVNEQPYPADYSLYGSVSPGPPTNAGVDILNQAIRNIVAEFDNRVRTVDLSGMNSDSSMFCPDKLHPSDKGHRFIAQSILGEISEYQIVPMGQRADGPRVEYGVAPPTSTDARYLPGSIVWNTAPTASGYVGWVCTTSGTPGTWKGFGSIQA